MTTNTAPTSVPSQSLPLPVTWEIRRVHDGSLISGHCSVSCARAAFEDLTLAQMMGNNPPGPLEWVQAEGIEMATGRAETFTRGLVPPDGLPPAEVVTYTNPGHI